MTQTYVKFITNQTLYFRKYNNTRLQIYAKYDYHYSDDSIENKEHVVGHILHGVSGVKFNGDLNSLLTISNMEIIINKMKELNS